MTRLTSGVPAPVIETSDFLGEPVSLAALRGRKVLLSFYRYASCPLCNLRMHQLVKAFPRLAPDIALISVFQSPAEIVGTYVGRQDAPFPIVPDPQRRLYARYGLESHWLGLFRKIWTSPWQILQAFSKGFLPGRVDGPFNAIPADFLIDENGVIQLAYYGRDIGDHLSMERIFQFIAGDEAFRQEEGIGVEG